MMAMEAMSLFLTPCKQLQDKHACNVLRNTQTISQLAFNLNHLRICSTIYKISGGQVWLAHRRCDCAHMALPPYEHSHRKHR